MKSLKVQIWLRNYLWGNGDVTATLEKLKSSFGIDYKQHSIHPSLFLLRYNQLECDFNNEIVCECRGLILDAAENWRVVAMPFTKFWNAHEFHAAKLDWNATRVQEKLDGSLISIAWYKDNFNISTSGCPDGLNLINDTGITFRDLALSCIEKQKIDLTEMSRYYTYIFELTSPLNRVVVDHKEAKLTLIGIRHNDTLKELPVSDSVAVSLFGPGRPPIVQEYSLSSLDDCLKAVEKLNPLEHEGYVAVDANFNRVKIKSPAYVAIHHIKDSCSLAKMAIVIKNGEYEEFLITLQSYPLVLEQFNKLVERYKDVVKTCTETYSKIKDLSNQKEFALLACQTEYSTVLFAMRKSGKSVQQILHDMLENTFLRLMGVK